MFCKYCEIEMDPVGFPEENCNGWLCPNLGCGHKEYDVASMKIVGEWWQKDQRRLKRTDVGKNV